MKVARIFPPYCSILLVTYPPNNRNSYWDPGAYIYADSRRPLAGLVPIADKAVLLLESGIFWLLIAGWDHFFVIIVRFATNRKDHFSHHDSKIGHNYSIGDVQLLGLGTSHQAENRILLELGGYFTYSDNVATSLLRDQRLQFSLPHFQPIHWALQQAIIGGCQQEIKKKSSPSHSHR